MCVAPAVIEAGKVGLVVAVLRAADVGAKGRQGGEVHECRVKRIRGKKS